MIVGLVIGKDKSIGVPGKNMRNICGRPSCEYGFIAAREVGVEHLFVSTDSPEIASVGRDYGTILIDRPPELATPDALTEDALMHAWESMIETIGKAPDIVCLFFANNPAISVSLVREGIEALRNNVDLDSAFSVCKYDMFSPVRARKIDAEGLIQPYVPLDKIGGQISSIRDSAEPTYFCDLSVQVLRSTCFQNMDTGLLPFKWMGRRSLALKNDFGFDVDTEWQLKVIEYWLETH